MKMHFFAALALTAFLPGHAFSETNGKWRKDFAQGYERYWTENASGARFAIWCPPNHSPRGTLIGIDIKGQLPPPGSEVLIQLDQKLIRFRADSNGYIRNDCPACTDNLTYFWHLMRSAGKLAVQFENKSYAGFSLNGAMETTPYSVCASQMAGRTQ